jgi:hypothetical protein
MKLIKILFTSILIISQLYCQNSIGINCNFYQSFRVLDYNTSDFQIQQKANSRAVDENITNVFEIGVIKMWDIRKHLNLGLGFNYSRMGYNLKELKNIRWPSEITSQGYMFDPSLPHNILPSNYLNYAEIPIIFEYNSNSRINFLPSISVVNQFYLNSLSKSKTDVGNETKFGKDKFVLPYNLALTAGIAMGYRVINNIEVKIGLNYKTQLLTAIKGDINETLYSYGLDIGVRYLINKNN